MALDAERRNSLAALRFEINHAHATLDTIGVPRAMSAEILPLSARMRLLQNKLKIERFIVTDEVRDSIENAFTQLLEAATAAHVQTLQRVNEQATNIFAVSAAQLASGAVKQETIVNSIADAIRALPPDKLVEFVKASGADVTNINVAAPSFRTLDQTIGDGGIDH